MTPQLRLATMADAEAVNDLFHRSFTVTFGHLYPPADLAHFLSGATAERVANTIGDPDCAVMLAEQEGGLLGFCNVGHYDLAMPTDRRWWMLRQLYMEDAAKGTGLALQLMDWAVNEARTRGYEELYLTVYVDNHRARRFYDRYGFVEVGRYEFAVGNTIDDDRIMRFVL